MTTRASATQALQIFWIGGKVRRPAQRTAQVLYEAKGGAIGPRRADGAFQRLANKFVLGHFGLPRQFFQARIELFGYAANQRCHADILNAFHGKCNVAFENECPVCPVVRDVSAKSANAKLHHVEKNLWPSSSRRHVPGRAAADRAERSRRRCLIHKRRLG
jgi:hypothetical protein